MSEFKFAIGQFVRIRESAKKVNKKYVKDNTYGTVDSVFSRLYHAIRRQRLEQIASL